jgi:signal transduction histidine kinase
LRQIKRLTQLFGRNNGALEDKRLSEVVRDLTLSRSISKALRRRIFGHRTRNSDAERRKYDVHIAPLEFRINQKAPSEFFTTSRRSNGSNRAQEFLSNVSHELRTPLTSILAFVETLEDGAINE